MFSFNSITLALIAALVATTKADPVPTSPFSTSVFDQGSNCTIQWNPDPTGVWKVMNIELMCGDNFHMIHMSTVASNLDGTDPSVTTFSYPCLKVTPNSPIYFYQFSSPDSANLTWTTRFTLAGPNGESTPAANATQPGTGAPIPWGVGTLVDPSQAVPAPVIGGQNSTSAAPNSASVSSLPAPSSVSLPSSLPSSPPSSSKGAPPSSSHSTAPAATSSSSAASHFPATHFALTVPFLSLLSFL